MEKPNIIIINNIDIININFINFVIIITIIIRIIIFIIIIIIIIDIDINRCAVCAAGNREAAPGRRLARPVRVGGRGKSGPVRVGPGRSGNRIFAVYKIAALCCGRELFIGLPPPNPPSLVIGFWASTGSLLDQLSAAF